MSVVFTVTVGRSGSEALCAAINKFSKNAFAEHEPPGLLLSRLGNMPFFRERNMFSAQGRVAQFGRDWQRRYLFTHEELGRGKSFEWVEYGDHESLQKVADKKARRVQRILQRSESYVEVSQYFIKTQAEYLLNLFPDMGLVKLTRNPLLVARSYANRDKQLFDGGPPPNWKQNYFRINDYSGLSRFQIYIHRWIETELRFHKFLERYSIKKVFYLPTEYISDPHILSKFFDYFDIEYKAIEDVPIINTNLQSKRAQTYVTDKDIREFQQILDMMPEHLINTIDYFDFMDSKYFSQL